MSGSPDTSSRVGLASRRAKLEELLREKLKSQSPTRIIPRLTDRSAIPLSFAQQRLWFLHQLDPASPIYNRPVTLRLSGPLETSVLEGTLHEIVRRHEILRTTFSSVNGRPVQIVAANQAVKLSIVDLREFPSVECGTRSQELLKEESRHPFDLAQGPLMRSTLFRLAPEEHLLLLVFHHIIFDAWSAKILVKEIASLYDSFSVGRGSTLQDLPIQYTDFACWQREYLQEKRLEGRLSFWEHQLCGSLSELNLPHANPHTGAPTFRGATQSFVLPDRLTDSLKCLSRQQGVTLFMTLLAAFQTLLHRYTGQDDIVVGSPVAGRTCVETEDLIGLFVNTLVLRADLSGNPRFRELLGRVRKMCLESFAHQEVPFEKLVEHLQPKRDLKRTPFFQVMFNLENIPGKIFETAHLKIEEIEFDMEVEPFDLTVEVVEKNHELTCQFSYKTDLFDASTIQRMVGHFQIVLEGIVATPERRILELPLLSGSERQQLFVEWSGTQAECVSTDFCFHQLFERQAERTPDGTAVLCGDHRLSYRELNSRSNQLAHRLQRLGVCSEARVGICLERSLDMVVALLGVLKAGGAYVPLDPVSPRERLAFMLQDTGVKVLLTQASIRDDLPPSGCSVVCLDTDGTLLAAESAENLDCKSVSENLAVVLYTSGTTGIPKGVLVKHRALAWYTQTAMRLYRLTPADRVLQFTSFSFDFSIDEIFSPLISGATLVLRNDAMLASISEFLQGCESQGITVLLLPTAFWHELAAVLTAEPGKLPSLLRLVSFGGEKVMPAHVVRWQQCFGHRVELMNGYGPTEATVVATYMRFSPTLAASTNFSNSKMDATQAALIGRPIAGAQVFILDQNLQPVPVGIPGELHVGGAGLARGYLNRPELTAEKFIINPFSEKPGERLYKTGDWARFLPDGNIEYLGRLDSQVKIRGFRVEPAEIENLLRQHPAIKDVVVISREDIPGDKRLIAYLVGRDQSVPSIKELRRSLKVKLPDYMIPSAFVTLEAMPLTPNGKVDRQALPAPDWRQSGTADVSRPPRDMMERLLIRIWEEVLGVRPIGVDDDFFALGGHSLLAVRLFAEIEKEFQRKLPLAVLFQAPTVGQLAEKLREENWSTATEPLIEIQPSGAKCPFFCVYPLACNVLYYYDLARYLGADQPFYGLQLQDAEWNHHTRLTIENLAAYYLEAIRRLQPEGPYLIAGYSAAGFVAFEMARQLRQQGHAVNLLALFDTDAHMAPQLIRSLPPAISFRYKAWSLKKNIWYHLDNALFSSVEQRRVYLANQFKRMRNRIQRYSLSRSTPSGLDAEHVALKVYRPRAYAGKVTLFRAVHRSTAAFDKSTYGWDGLAAEGVEVHEIPGRHVGEGSILNEPHVRVLAERLRECIDKARDD